MKHDATDPFDALGIDKKEAQKYGQRIAKILRKKSLSETAVQIVDDLFAKDTSEERQHIIALFAAQHVLDVLNETEITKLTRMYNTTLKDFVDNLQRPGLIDLLRKRMKV